MLGEGSQVISESSSCGLENPGEWERERERREATHDKQCTYLDRKAR